MDQDEIKMIKIIILNRLRDEIYKTFKKDSLKIYSLIGELQHNPNKGKVLGHVGNMSIRELRYNNFRFYFILDGHKLYLFNNNQIQELLIRFIKMSTKKQSTENHRRNKINTRKNWRQRI